MINNLEDLRTHLSKAFDDLEKNAIDVKKADALANMVGKLISSCKVELEYKGLVARHPNVSIPFLDGGHPVETKQPGS